MVFVRQEPGAPSRPTERIAFASPLQAVDEPRPIRRVDHVDRATPAQQAGEGSRQAPRVVQASPIQRPPDSYRPAQAEPRRSDVQEGPRPRSLSRADPASQARQPARRARDEEEQG